VCILCHGTDVNGHSVSMLWHFRDVNGVKGLIVVSVDARSLGVFVALVFVVATSLVDCIISVVVGVVRDVVVHLDVAGVVECVLRDLFVLAAGVLFDVVGVVDRVLLDVAAFVVVIRGFVALLDVVGLFDLPF
jgi:Na+-translocating ferredoxin:NAD+ oxidoreductase RnfD subunit